MYEKSLGENVFRLLSNNHYEKVKTNKFIQKKVNFEKQNFIEFLELFFELLTTKKT